MFCPRSPSTYSRKKVCRWYVVFSLEIEARFAAILDRWHFYDQSYLLRQPYLFHYNKSTLSNKLVSSHKKHPISFPRSSVQLLCLTNLTTLTNKTNLQPWVVGVFWANMPLCGQYLCGGVWQGINCSLHWSHSNMTSIWHQNDSNMTSLS